MFSYSQSTGVLTDEAGDVVGAGYAGNGDGLNNPDMQCTQGVGPLPQGVYTIGEPHNSPSTGRVTMNLEPDPSNDMCGRSLFRIHGDNPAMNHTASDGCIIMPLNIRYIVAQACGWHVTQIPTFTVTPVAPTCDGRIQVIP